MGIGVGRTYCKLTARAVATVSKPGYHGDGGGLYLQVTPAGSRSWIFRFTRHGRAREMGLGSAQLVSLADARREAISCRVMLHQGIDPIEARRSERRQRRATAPTFAACAESYVASHRDGWHNAKHAAQWTSTL
ncbi:Arm DNA-binding domain-containing protein, partial [Acidisphaera rubrifaciens]|uniref:Arm DNA-binding domain-containing protein n=1 Tax=Acidisphaera rubrifaciens TaxID=50715 RepID=UPI0011DDA295